MRPRPAPLSCWSAASWGFVNDLPVRVFPDYLPVAEFPVVASTYLNPDSLWRRTGQQPFGDAPVAADTMPVVTVVDVRETLEAVRQAFPHGRLAREAFAPGIRPPRHVQCAIVGKELHDGVQVVGVERIGDCLQCRDGNGLQFGHAR